MIKSSSNSPRRAVSIDSFDQPTSEVDVVIDSRGSARRGRSARIGRGAVAAVLAGVLSAGTLFGYAFSARGGEDMSIDQVAVDMAVPDAAVQAVEQGFADRTQDASRNAVRSNLTEAVAGETARSRSEAMDASVDSAYATMTADSAAEREAKMDEDMKLVRAQADKLKKEAEEAARRLEEARKAAEAEKARQAKAAQQAVASTGSKKVPAADIAAATSTGGSMPVKSNYRVGAGFGATGSWSRYHTGQDFPAPSGTPIYAVASGIVLSPTAGGWAGINVVIQHGNNGATLYAHMSGRTVSPGQAVKAGQLIGYVGNTGRSFGSHLHLEYYKPGVTPGDVYSASNPMSFIRRMGG